MTWGLWEPAQLELAHEKRAIKSFSFLNSHTFRFLLLPKQAQPAICTERRGWQISSHIVETFQESIRNIQTKTGRLSSGTFCPLGGFISLRLETDEAPC